MFNPKIAIIGLGYVGLPLAVSLARFFSVIGFDIDQNRITDLRQGIDKTREISKDTLTTTSLSYTHHLEDIRHHDLYIVTVPTPVTDQHLPDLSLLEKASTSIGSVIGPDCVVVFESTVYPGVTEEVCGALLEKASGLTAGKDFFLGYSPERLNPGDCVHTVEHITKVVSADNPKTLDFLKKVYGKINQDNVFCAANIKTAEAAKVIENAQRDINVAFMNEVAHIMHQTGLCMQDILEAAQTKWNFLPFHPGLVGGHCIGVDPYYLAHYAQMNHLPSHVILSGRSTNEKMGPFIASCLKENLSKKGIKQGQILVFGLTFKENVPDLRNTKAIDVINLLKQSGHCVDVYDPHVIPSEAQQFLGIDVLGCLSKASSYDAVVCLVAHDEFRSMDGREMASLLKPDGLVADLRGIWKTYVWPQGCTYWTL